MKNLTLEQLNEKFKLTAEGKTLDERIKKEYQGNFESVNKTLMAKTEVLIDTLKKHGTEKNFNFLLEELKFKLPRLSYLKNYEINGKMYDIEIDNLTLEWSIN